MSASIGHLLNRQLEVWREVGEDDGYGGRRTARSRYGEPVPAKVDQPTPAERTLAQQAGSAHTHNVYLLPGTDVARGDQLRGDGEVYRVISTVSPSTPIYLKAECELIQPAPA